MLALSDRFRWKVPRITLFVCIIVFPQDGVWGRWCANSLHSSKVFRFVLRSAPWRPFLSTGEDIVVFDEVIHTPTMLQSSFFCFKLVTLIMYNLTKLIKVYRKNIDLVHRTDRYLQTLFWLQISGHLSNSADPPDSQGGATDHNLHMDVRFDHHLALGSVLSSTRHVDFRSRDLRMRPIVALRAAEEGLLPGGDLLGVLHRAPPSHLHLLFLDLLSGLAPWGSRPDDQLGCHQQVKGQGPQDADSCRHLIRLLVAPSVRRQHATELRSRDDRDWRTWVRSRHADRHPDRAVARPGQQLCQPDRLLSLQQEIPPRYSPVDRLLQGSATVDYTWRHLWNGERL